MDCPYCKNKMEKGYIRADSAIYWHKDCYGAAFRPDEGEVLIKYQGAKDFFRNIHFEGYICKECRFVCFKSPPNE